MNMKFYIGTKLVQATPMDRSNYNRYRGWTLPADEDGSDMGMLVEYPYEAEVPPNHPDHKGYISWSPDYVFHKSYHADGYLNFGHALELMKAQEAVQRRGWNGKNMFIVMMPPLYLPPYNTQDTARKVNDRTAKWIGENSPLDCQPYIAMFTADAKWQPGWLPSQADLFAEDWQTYPNDNDY